MRNPDSEKDFHRSYSDHNLICDALKITMQLKSVSVWNNRNLGGADRRHSYRNHFSKSIKPTKTFSHATLIYCCNSFIIDSCTQLKAIGSQLSFIYQFQPTFFQKLAHMWLKAVMYKYDWFNDSSKKKYF